MPTFVLPAGGSFDAVATPLWAGPGSATNAALAMAPNGRATAMWSYSTGTVVQFAERTVSPDFAGGTWSAAGRASPLGVTANSPSVAVDTQNTAIAVWRANDGNEFVQGGTRPSGGSFTNFQPLSGATAGGFSSRR